jgi:hypothetical protein
VLASRPFHLTLLTQISESRLNLIPITKASAGPLSYEYNLNKSIQLPGAHGEEIVRDLFTDLEVRRITFTAFSALTRDRRAQHIHAEKTATSARGSSQKTRAWMLTKKRSPRRREVAIRRKGARIRRRSARARRKDSSRIEESHASPVDSIHQLQGQSI